MSEKLTKEEMKRIFYRSAPAPGWSGDWDAIWQAIEADREAVRAEMRDGLLKDHFKIGEDVEIEKSDGEWFRGRVFASTTLAHTNSVSHPRWVRRPAKKRQMTHLEMASKVGDVYNIGREEARILSDATLIELLLNRRFAIEVDE